MKVRGKMGGDFLKKYKAMTAIILYLTSFKIILFRLFCYFIFLLYLWHIF